MVIQLFTNEKFESWRGRSGHSMVKQWS